MKLTEETMYYKNEPKTCSNCVHYRKPVLLGLEKCKLQPHWVLDSAFEDCMYKHWIPNKRLKEKENNCTN